MKASRAALVVFFCSLAARLGVWTRVHGRPDSLMRTDSATYLIPAANLLKTGVFSSAQDAPYAPEPKRTPGYPLFLAGHLLVSQSPVFPAATQCLLDAGTAALAGWSAALLSGLPPAAFLGLLYGLDPLAATDAPVILSEPLFTFLIVLAVFLLLQEGKKPRPLPVVLSGLCLGLATWARPISLYLWLPWGAALAWVWRDRLRRMGIVFAAAAALLPAAWCGRNLAEFGHFEFSSITGLNALLWEAAAVQAIADRTPLEAGRQAMKDEFARSHPAPIVDPFEESHLRSALAKQVMLAHPAALFRLHLVSTVKMLLTPGLNEIAKTLAPDEPLPTEESLISSMAGVGTLAVLKARPRLWPVFVTEGLILLATYGLALVGAWKLWRMRDSLSAAVVGVPLLYLVVLSAGGWSYYRFRLPLLPLFVILGGAALNPRRDTKS